jgi:hypothetical protein
MAFKGFNAIFLTVSNMFYKGSMAEFYTSLENIIVETTSKIHTNIVLPMLNIAARSL